MQQPLVCQGYVIIEASLSHSDTPQSAGHVWTNDRPVTGTFTWQHATLTRDISMPPVGFEPAVPASEKPKIHALDRAATEIGLHFKKHFYISVSLGKKRTANPSGQE
jgi:hypothetical protein